MREKRASIVRKSMSLVGAVVVLAIAAAPAWSQMYDSYDSSGGAQPYGPPGGNQSRAHPGTQVYHPAQPPVQHPTRNLQYDQRDAEMILRDQASRRAEHYPSPQAEAPNPQSMYDNYYPNRIHDEGQVRVVMDKARRIASIIKKRNGKAFIVIDKTNFQFYLYDRNGRLLRIGPVAIGKGKTRVGSFETRVGIYPIKRKEPVADWTRPDWYFIEEGEPIPKRHQDRVVPGFFRFKLVFDGMRYIHYAEATGGRLTHGCLGLDWPDAEAVFHTLRVGSYCIVVDNPFLVRLARGEFPIKKPAPAVASKPKEGQGDAVVVRGKPGPGARSFRNLW
jgi:lipoprotein-anchoring transpeptidase ErfK/SrfK